MSELTPEGGNEQGSVSILQVLPNLVTLIGMCFGLTSIRFAIEGRFGTAVFLILLAALADGLDGILARKLGAESAMGAQLDSLSDFLSFGVAPAILVYQIHLTGLHGFGWIFPLLFATAACLRLARFNVMSGQADDGAGPKLHFVGVPAPAGAMLGLLPVFLTLIGVFDAKSAPIGVAFWLALVGLLMISKLKTPSPKAVAIPRKLVALLFFTTVVMIGMSFTRPWFILILMDAAYLVVVAHAIFRAKGRIFSG